MDKPTLADLRALALDYRPTLPFFVCLDRDKRTTLAGLRFQLSGLKSRLDNLQKMDADQYAAASSMGEPDPIDAAKARMEEVAAAIVAAEDDARPWSITITFAVLPATDEGLREGEGMSYAGLLDTLTKASELGGFEGRVSGDEFADVLMSHCYQRAESADGENLNLAWADAIRVLDMADIEVLRNLIIGVHRTGASIPFDPRTSGPSATI